MSKTQDIDEVLADEFSDSEENLNLEKLQIGSPEKGERREGGKRKVIKQQQQHHQPEKQQQKQNLVSSPLPSPTISSHHHHQLNYDKNEEVALLGPLWKDYPLVQKTIPSSYSFCSSSHHNQLPSSSSCTPSSYYNTTTKTAINPPPLFSRNYRSSSMGTIFGGPKPSSNSSSSSSLLSPPKLLDYNNHCTGGLCTSTLVSPSCSRPDSGSFSPYASCYSGYSGRFNNTSGSINGLDVVEPLSRSSSQSSGFISQTGGIHTPPPSSIVNNNNNSNNNSGSNLSSSNSMYGGRDNNTNILPPSSSSCSSVFGGRNMIQHHNINPIFSSQYQQQQQPPPQDEQQSFVSFSTMTTNRHHRHHHPHHYYSSCNKFNNNNHRNNNNISNNFENVPIWSTTATMTGSLFKPTMSVNNGLNSIMENGNTCSRFASGSNEGSLYLKKLFGIRRTAMTTTTTANFCLNKYHQHKKTTSSGGNDGDLENDTYSADDDDDDNVSFKSAVTSLTTTHGNLDGQNNNNNNNFPTNTRRRNHQKNDRFGFVPNNGKNFNSSLSFDHHDHHQQQLQENVPGGISSKKSTRSKNSILSGPTIRNLRAKSFLRNNNNNESDHTEEDDKYKTVTSSREKGWISKTYSLTMQLFWRLSLFINVIVMFWFFFGSTYDPHESHVLHHVFHNLTDTVVKNTPIVWDSLITNFLEVTSYVLNILFTQDYLLGQGGGGGVEEYQNSFNYTNPTVLEFEDVN